MEWLLRSQIHLELAKCNEEIEQLQSAEHHFLKAMAFDDAGVHKEQLSHSLSRLRLRAELYVTPELVDDQVAMILEQCVVGGKSEKRLTPAIQQLVAKINHIEVHNHNYIQVISHRKNSIHILHKINQLLTQSNQKIGFFLKMT